MNLRDKRGSIALFVMIGMVFMSSFLLISYSNNLNKSKIVKDQYDMVSDIYYKNESDGNIYNAVYSDLREKKKEVKTTSSQNSTILNLSKIYAAPLEEYKIYAGANGLGSWNSNKKKYEIKIEVTSGSKTKTYDIELNQKLNNNEYIDYKRQCIVSVNNGVETIKGDIALPIIYTYESNSKITVTAGETPKMIWVKYVGYTI